MRTFASRARALVENADYDFVRTDSGWRCQDALLVDEVVSEHPTLGNCILQAAEALGITEDEIWAS